GNSNWRGPVWMPLNCLLIESLYEYHRYYGDGFKVECPVGSGNMATLEQVAQMLSRRLAGLSLKDENGRRAVMASYPDLVPQADGADLMLFHEYYHGETGAGLGASHQTGWSGMVALLLQPRRESRRGKLPDCG
ncbi:MAG: MGH1-like glycoside hydrolase domain-containing protein, partial [Janthinobacterium lividum]